MKRRHCRVYRGGLGVVDRREGEDIASVVPGKEQVGDVSALVLPVIVGEVFGDELV
jgi:hypothetical protein